MKNFKKSFLMSTVALLLCFLMFLGTTFAWFTDEVTSSANKIIAGNLKLDLEVLDKATGAWYSVKENSDPIFNYENWEPGYTNATFLKVENEGNLALKWQARFSSSNGVSKLAEVIDVYVLPSETELSYNNLTRDLDGWQKVGTLDQFINTLSDTTYGYLEEAGEVAYLGIALHMQEDAGNEYQGIGLEAFDIQIVATQMSHEDDSFGPDYDNDAEWPEGEMNFEATQSVANIPTLYGELTEEVIIRYNDAVYAILPAGVKLADGVSELKFSGKSVENGENITLGEGDSAKSYDIHIEGIHADNQKPITVHLGAIAEKNLNETSLKLFHEDVQMTRVSSIADFAISNQFTYNPDNGTVVIYVNHFSVFSAVETTADEWDGTSDTTWYNENDTEFTLTTAEQFAGFRDLVDGGNTFAGKSVKLGADIDLDKKPFDPIGFSYYDDDNSDGKTNYRVFMGTFDGAGHTIYNLYQNCWELDPDKTNYSTYTYSTAGAGLFASIKDATIKNLAVSGAEIVFECVDMGVVVGYAQGKCHFENIIVTDSNIANYNRYTGGVVGEVSYGPYGIDTTKGYSHTFKNVVVDSSVKVSGLWGSFGCGMGGVIGGKWGDATVKMENVISAAEMDIYNDVVSAYQWYAFRGCGMLIGHTEEPYSDGRHSGNATASFLTCENVKVYYGDWVNYHYYEFENQDNTTGQRYPWVRAEAGEYCDAFSNIRYGVPTHNGVKVSDLTEEELKAIATDYTPIVFDQLYGADRGMYGTATHEGVTVSYDGVTTKTIYILNDADWTDLKLHYWYAKGDETWTTVSETGISLEKYKVPNFDVYVLELPEFIAGFKITSGNENEITFNFDDVENGSIYTLSGEVHEHYYDNNGECVCGAYIATKCQLVTSVDDLSVGDSIVIVAKDNAVAISTTQNNNNRGQAEIVRGDNTILINDNVQIIKLESGNIANTFSFKVDNGYLYAASSSSNYLRTETSLSNNSSWSIEISDDVATIKAQGTNTRNWLRYNSNNSLFSCYSSGQQDVQIYKVVSGDGTIDVHNCYDFAIYENCEDDAICSKCSNVIADSARGHDYVGVQKAPTCTDAGYITYTCSRCDNNYIAKGEKAIGHNYVDGICSVCGAIDSTAIDYSGRYYFATIRTSGNYFYMTSSLGTASTKRYQATDTGSATLPLEITNGENDKVFVLEKNEDGTYSIYAEGVEGENYLGWTSDNSGILVAKENALKLTVDKKENETYNIHFTTSDVERYLALNQNTGSNYFAWYKSGQKQDLTLIPVKPCEHSYGFDTVAPTCTEDGYTTHTCTKCGNSYTDSIVAATGHVNKTTTTVDATCTEAGSTTVTCDDCGETVRTEEIPATGHTTDNGVCDNCGLTIGGTTAPIVVSTFAFGANGSESHSDGSAKTSYSETNNGYTLNLSSMTNIYTGARDAKGNSCIKLGASSKAGSFSFTVPNDVTKVIIYVAQYKANNTKITVNGTSYTITTASNNGEYTAIEIDTSTTKTVTFTTVSGGYRAMINTIEFCK